MNKNVILQRPTRSSLDWLNIGAIPLPWLQAVFRLMAVGLAGLHAWVAAKSHSMNPDGISYLDIGDAYFRGDWETAINAVWSPMYSWLLGASLWLLQPSMQWEFPAVHLVNFIIYLAALASFEFMWYQLAQTRHMYIASTTDRVFLPEWAWWSIGYLIFIWATLSLIQIWAVTPDMLMAIFVFLAAGLLVRIRAGRDSYATYALLGCVLGLGYLSKAVMLPVSLFFLGAALVASGNLRRTIPRALIAFGIFLVVSLPFMLLLTNAQGRFTYGEAGTLTYVRHVNGIVYPHWQGESSDDGVPLHPSRQIFREPPIFEFGTPIGGTYPISYDPAYWYEGVVVRFDPVNQARQLLASGLFYIDLFAYQQGGIVLCIAIVYALGWRPDAVNRNVRKWLLTMVALLALLLYAPVLVAGRYVGVFVILLWSDLMVNASVPNSRISERLVSVLSIFMMAFLLLNIALFNLRGLVDLSNNVGTAGPGVVAAGPPSWPGEVAEALWEKGIQPGDGVAVIGYAFDSYWARLARVKIVAELLSEHAGPFWHGDLALQQQVIDAFAGTAAKAIVAEYVPPSTDMTGWHRVSDSNFYIYLLMPEESPK